MSQALKPIEDGDFPYGVLSGNIYVGADGRMHTDGPQWNGSDTLSVGPNGDGTGKVVAATYQIGSTATTLMTQVSDSIHWQQNSSTAKMRLKNATGLELPLGYSLRLSSSSDILAAYGADDVVLKQSTTGTLQVFQTDGVTPGTLAVAIVDNPAADLKLSSGSTGTHIIIKSNGIDFYPNGTKKFNIGTSSVNCQQLLWSSTGSDLGSVGAPWGQAFVSDLNAAGDVTVSGTLGGAAVSSYLFKNQASSHTNPTIIPHSSYLSTGLGGDLNKLSLISAGVEIARADSTAGFVVYDDLTVNGRVDIIDGNGSIYFDGSAVTSGYACRIVQDDTGLTIGHDSAVRDLILMTGSLARVTISGTGTATFNHDAVVATGTVSLGSNTGGNLRGGNLAGSNIFIDTTLNFETINGMWIDAKRTSLSTFGVTMYSVAALKWNASASDNLSGHDVQVSRSSTGQNHLRADAGTAVRNFADTADAPLTAGSITVSGSIFKDGILDIETGGTGTKVQFKTNASEFVINGSTVFTVAASAINCTRQLFTANASDLGTVLSPWGAFHATSIAIQGDIAATGSISVGSAGDPLVWRSYAVDNSFVVSKIAPTSVGANAVHINTGVVAHIAGIKSVNVGYNNKASNENSICIGQGLIDGGANTLKMGCNSLEYFTFSSTRDAVFYADISQYIVGIPGDINFERMSNTHNGTRWFFGPQAGGSGTAWPLVIDASGAETQLVLNTDGTVDIGGALTTSAAVNRAVATITAASTTLDATHHYVFADTTSNDVTLNLPAIATCVGRPYTIKFAAGGNTVILDGSGAETIDGATTQTLTTLYESLTIVNNGTEWSIV